MLKLYEDYRGMIMVVALASSLHGSWCHELASYDSKQAEPDREYQLQSPPRPSDCNPIMAMLGSRV